MNVTRLNFAHGTVQGHREDIRRIRAEAARTERSCLIMADLPGPNERHYGALQGRNKAETAAKHGEGQVLIWRKGYETSPPPVSEEDDRFLFFLPLRGKPEGSRFGVDKGSQ